MRPLSWIGIVLLLVTGDLQAADWSNYRVRVEHCLVSLIQDVQVPAQEAGVLVDMSIREGEQVSTGALLGRIYDTPIQMERRAAVADRNLSHEKATSDVAVRYADASRKFAKTEYDLNKKANDRVPGTKPDVELQKLQTAIDQASLEIEKARHEQKLAAFETDKHTAKVDQADDDIQRRQIRAPLNGEVVEIKLQPGEWAKPGDPIVRIIRMDRLRVEAFVKIQQLSPRELTSRPVEVAVRLSGGQLEVFSGRIVFIDPRIQAGGEYRVWAEVDNRMDDDHWLLRPGLEADMTIGLNLPDCIE